MAAEETFEEATEHEEEDRKTELERLQKESAAMIKLLKVLGEEENELRIQNEILAREALLNGFSPNIIEAPASKRRKSSSKKNESNN